MWGLIEKRKTIGADLDYLQIFQLSPQGRVQKIIHSQEKPKYSNEITVPTIGTPIAARVWVIDSGEYSTMLLPSEY